MSSFDNLVLAIQRMGEKDPSSLVSRNDGNAIGSPTAAFDPVAVVCEKITLVPKPTEQSPQPPAEEVGAEPAADAMWVEEDHPRSHGRFTTKGGGETFSKGDALAVHEALAAANGELVKQRERQSKGHATGRNDTPMSDLMKAHEKVSNLTKVAKIVKPGERISASGLGEAHRAMFKNADRRDRRPEYGPEGAKREDLGVEVRTHPFHQAVVEAFQSIREKADAISAAQQKNSSEGVAGPASEKGGKSKYLYPQSERIHRSLSLGSYVSPDEIDAEMDRQIGDGGHGSEGELTTAVYRNVEKLANQRHDEAMMAKYHGQRYDSAGAPNW